MLSSSSFEQGNTTFNKEYSLFCLALTRMYLFCVWLFIQFLIDKSNKYSKSSNCTCKSNISKFVSTVVLISMLFSMSV